MILSYSDLFSIQVPNLHCEFEITIIETPQERSCERDTTRSVSYLTISNVEIASSLKCKERSMIHGINEHMHNRYPCSHRMLEPALEICVHGSTRRTE